MDFNQFDSRAAAETPRELHLKHPVTGEPMFDGDKPCIALVLGSESRTVQTATRAKAKAALSDKPGDKDIGDDLAATAKPLITGFKNISRGNKPATLEDVDWFLGLQIPNGNELSFVEQVITFATDRAKFLGNVSAA